MNPTLNVTIRIIVAAVFFIVPVVLTVLMILWSVLIGTGVDSVMDPRLLWRKLYKWVREPIDGIQI